MQEMTPLRFGKRTKDIPTQHPLDYGLIECLRPEVEEAEEYG